MTELSPADVKAKLANPNFCVIKYANEWKELEEQLLSLSANAKYLGIDTETTGLDPRTDRVRLIQIASADQCIVVDLNAFRVYDERQVDWDLPGLSTLRFILESKKPKVLQNAAFDLNFLRGEGIELGGYVFDTMVASKIINNGTGAKNDLGSIAERALKVKLEKELQKADWAGPISPDMFKYAARDALILPMLVPHYVHMLTKSKPDGRKSLMSIFEMEMQCLRPIAFMQWYGFGFNEEAAVELRDKLQQEADAMLVAFLATLDEAIRAKHPDDPRVWLPRDPDGSFNTREKDSGSIRKGTKQYAGFNPRSPKQMAARFKQAGLILPPDAKGEASMDKNLLSFVRGSQPLVDAYMTWKTCVTRVSCVQKLIDNVADDNRIHGTYRQMGTDTGRLSAAEPNLQQVPREATFRSLFKAAPGYTLVVADFSQVELRVAAQLSQEPRMLEAYRDGRDLHTETAALVTGKSPEDITKAERTSAKICFSLDTEVLTLHGWVALEEYKGQDVAQYVLPAGAVLNRTIQKPGPGYVAGTTAPWDGNNGEIEFVAPLRHERFHSDDVWHSADRNHDVMATGNHNIFYIDAYGNAQLRPLVETINPRLFVAAGYKKTEGITKHNKARLLAMVVADGSFKSHKDKVTFGFSKRRKIHRCEDILVEMGIAYKKALHSNGDNGKTTHISFALEEAPWLLDFTTVDKELKMSACLLGVDKLAYLAEAQYWDGTAIKARTRGRVRVGTSVKVTADVMQAMAVTSGLPCTVHTETLPTGKSFYVVSYAFRTAPTWRPTWAPKQVEPQEVSCVQVPSGLILIRRNGKVSVQGNCNFGLLYGSGAATLRKQAIAQYGVDMSHTEAQKLVQNFRAAYPQLKAWQDREGEGTTHAVYTKIGRRRMLLGYNDKYTTRINTQVQGTAGDIAKLAICKLWNDLGGTPSGEARLIAMVHDEIVLEVRDDLVDLWSQRLVEAMQTAGAEICEDVPIVADVSSGRTWAEAK